MTTPARKQYLDIKAQHQNDLLLFRMGDFYETFDEDAKILAKELEIALTTREMGKGTKIPLAGIPFHSLETYLPRLVENGHRVAICEQTSDASTSKGIVSREVIRIITPGTIVEESLLQGETNNFLAALLIKDGQAGLAHTDITTGTFAITQLDESRVGLELARLSPKELIVPTKFVDSTILNNANCTVTQVNDDNFNSTWSTSVLTDHFSVNTLESFGVDRMPLAVDAAAAIIQYVRDHEQQSLRSLTSLSTYSTEDFMVLDEQTRRNLELFVGGRWDSKQASLFAVLNRTNTPMGGRMLRSWIGQPALNISLLNNRYETIEWFKNNRPEKEQIKDSLKKISDLERLCTKILHKSASPRDLSGISHSINTFPVIKEIIMGKDESPNLQSMLRGLSYHDELATLLSNAISKETTTTIGDGKTIRSGFSSELDEARKDSESARNYMTTMESRERQTTGIKSLKVGYNKVFGYYIEVSNSNLDSVPQEYIRKQTLVSAERYITPEMKECEARILAASERIGEIETRVFRQICDQVSHSVTALLKSSEIIANLDVLISLATVAEEYGYVRPLLDNSGVLEIKGGRHPIIERIVETGSFISNDTNLDIEETQIVLLTGPNMSGKSTYLRQVGLITLMAQIGSYVPAQSARIGMVDRIFTRVGLQDDLTVGQSTFMLEMVETASILNQASKKSLIILDEIGRGTSTYDGLAIAQSVAEHIHNHPGLGCKTLFATHYHELTNLADTLPRVKNLHVSVSENKGEVVFLRNILPGGADKSYGIHVARLAGLPSNVITRAWSVLSDLENQNLLDISREENNSTKEIQLPLITQNPAFVDDLKNLDIMSITPLEAITLLYEFQKKAQDDAN